MAEGYTLEDLHAMFSVDYEEADRNEHDVHAQLTLAFVAAAKAVLEWSPAGDVRDTTIAKLRDAAQAVHQAVDGDGSSLTLKDIGTVREERVARRAERIEAGDLPKDSHRGEGGDALKDAKSRVAKAPDLAKLKQERDPSGYPVGPPKDAAAGEVGDAQAEALAHRGPARGDRDDRPKADRPKSNDDRPKSTEDRPKGREDRAKAAPEEGPQTVHVVGDVRVGPKDGQ